MDSLGSLQIAMLLQTLRWILEDRFEREIRRREKEGYHYFRPNPNF